MEALSDNALMQKVKAGDVDWLGLLFERYKKPLFGFFYNMNHNAATSEDLVQATFLRILKYRKGFKGTGDFKVWMFHIARNLNRDHYKKDKWKNGEDVEDHKDRLGSDKNIEGDWIHDDQLDMLQLAMRRLSNEKKEVIVMSKIKEMKYKQIAEILECSEGAVKVKVFRALQELKKEFEHIQSRV